MQQNHVPTAAELIVGAALGCNTAWASMAFKSLSLYTGLAQSEAILDTVYLVSIVCVALTLVVAGVYDQATERLLSRKESMWALPVLVAASTLAMPASAALPDGASVVGMVAAGAVAGVASGLFLIRFGIAFSRLSTNSCVIGATTGTVLASLLFALFLLFDRLSACAFAASMPVLAGLLLSYGMHMLVDQGKAEPESASAHDAQACGGSSRGSKSELLRLTAKLAASSVLVGFSAEVVRTLYVQMGVKDLGGTAYALVEGGGAFAATVIVVGIALLLATLKTPRMARNIYHFLILLLVAGALVLLVPVVYGRRAALVPHALNSASYACFGMLMWTILAGVCNRWPAQRVRTFAFVRAGWAAGPLLGLVVGRFVLHGVGISIDSAMPVMMASVIAILAASGFAFSETDLVRAMDLLPLQRKQHFREKCAKVAADYALSEREHEVMVLLAKGRNLPFIQEELLLSKSTVSTHRQHIYAKLDIHSQQELINLVQETQA